MTHPPKISQKRIQAITSDLRQLLICQQPSDLETAIKVALEAFMSVLGAASGYCYMLDPSEQGQLSCRYQIPENGRSSSLTSSLVLKNIEPVMTRLKSEKIFWLDKEQAKTEQTLSKIFFSNKGNKSPYLFIRSKSSQDMLIVLILRYETGALCPDLSEKEEIINGVQEFTNLVVHHKTLQENESRYQFEKVLREISKQMINPPPDQIDSKITAGLKAITQYFDVDRGTIFQLISEHPTGILTHLYARVEPFEIPDGEIVTAEDFPYLANEHLVKKRITYISSLDELPEEAQKDRESYMKWGTKSSLNIPLLAGDEVYGTLSFSNIRKEIKWPKDIVSRATVIGEIFSSSLARKHADEALQNSLKEIKHLKERLESENTYLQKEIKQSHNFDDIIGESRALKTVLLKITQCAPTDAPAIILGETGTGKELIARAVHAKSRRNDRPLIKVDCGSLPATMIERELFGHEKGAFTGAHQQQKGRFEIADGGTLFLDEVGELPIELQSKLLRVLQDGEFERLGNPKTRKINVRIIAATNRNLEEEIENGNFRSDLWYRLNVFPITVPPLRERPEDIPLLVNWFANKYSKKMGKPITRIPENILADLSGRYWAGNVRELENTIQRAVIISIGEVLELSDPVVSEASAPQSPTANITLESVEREHIRLVLEKTNGRIYGPKGAALILGLNPSTLRFRIKKLGIDKPSK